MKYNENHDWVDVKDDIATIGITSYAQEELGDIVYVELPKLGHKIVLGDVVAVLESTKAAVDIYAPLSGEILEVNTKLLEFPEKINRSAEKEGWIYKLKISNKKELETLLGEKEYRAMVEPLLES